MITPEEARRELARRELARREAARQESAPATPSTPAPSDFSQTSAGTFRGGVQSVLQGLTFGLSDELQSWLDGTDVNQIRADMADFSKNYPAADIAGQIGGGAITAALTSGAMGAAKSAFPALSGIANGVAEALPGWMRAMGGAAAGGAAYGAGSAVEGERLSGAAKGAAIGAGGAGALLLGGKLTGAAYDKILRPAFRMALSTPSRDAEYIINTALKKAGLNSMDEAYAAMREYGDDAMLLDLDNHLRDVAYATRAGTGPGRNLIDTPLIERAKGAQARIMTAASQTLGANAEDATAFIKTIETAKAQQAAPYYASAHQQNIRTNADFDFLWQGVPRQAIARARELAKAEHHASGAGPFDWDAVPDVKRVDYVKRAWDDRISGLLRKDGARQAAAAEIKLRNKLLDFVDSQVPDFKKARGIWAGGSQLEDAARFGREIFKQDADELESIVARYGKSEQQAFRYGVAQAFRDKVESAGDTHNAVNRLARSMKNRRIIKAAFNNSDEFEAFIKQLDAEDVFAQSRNQITGNSRTAERAQRQAEIAGDMPYPSRTGLAQWALRNVLPKSPLENPDTNRLVAEALTRRAPPTGAPPNPLILLRP